jgi:hypothetical protein
MYDFALPQRGEIALEALQRGKISEARGPPASARGGARAVVSLSSYSMKENRSNANLWLLSTSGGRPRVLTTSGEKDGQPHGRPTASESRSSPSANGTGRRTMARSTSSLGRRRGGRLTSGDRGLGDQVVSRWQAHRVHLGSGPIAAQPRRHGA